MYQLLYNRIKTGYLEPIVHLVFWSIFISGEIVVATTIAHSDKPLLHYVLFYILNIALVYLHIWALLHQFSIGKGNVVLKQILFSISGLVVYFLLAIAISSIIKRPAAGHFFKTYLDLNFLVPILWRGIYFILLGTAYYLLKMTLRQKEIELGSRLEIEKLKSKLLISEKEFLRAQINPHLLFNTLAFIRHATRHQPEQARAAISYLSDVMSYAIHEGKDEFVALEREVEQIDNIIQLNRLRFEGLHQLIYSKKIEQQGIKIIPIVLLTLVENVFKHGNVLHKDYPAKIEIIGRSDTILFTSCNLLDTAKKEESRKIGLANIKERLDISYPGKFTFTHKLHHNLFLVELRINL